MTILIIGAVLFWAFRMGGIDTIKSLIGGIGGGGGGDSAPNITTGTSSILDGKTISGSSNNFTNNRINTTGGSGSHGQSIVQQSSNINGVITKSEKRSAFNTIPRI